MDPWFQWNCNTKKGKCKTLPYSVSSFSVSQNQTKIGSGHCDNGKKKPSTSGAAGKSESGCFVFVAMIVAAIALTLRR